MSRVKRRDTQGQKPKELGASATRLKSCPDTEQAPAAQEQLVEIGKPVRIEKPVYGGSFLARDQGKAVFVPLTLPGEQARIRIVEEKRGYASAEVTEIVAPAPERVVPECRHFGACGGCDYQHATYGAQLGFKQAVLRETLERGGVRAADGIAEIAVLFANPWAYRNRIRLAFDAAGNPGYRGRRSHAVIPIAECPIAAPLLVRAAQAIAETAKKSPAHLRPSEMSLFCDAQESALLVGLYSDGPAKIALDNFCRELAEKIPELKGAEHTTEGRAGRPLRTMAQFGAASLTYRAAGFDYRVDQSAFFQVNRWLVDTLVHQVTDNRRGALAWDLFAGVGLFARQLASSFNRVVAVESAPSATAALEHNLNGAAATAVRASTLDFLRRTRSGQRPDLIVVDPPRTGLGADVTSLLSEIAAPALAYVSCDPATLARDLRALIGSGYAIEKMALADLFPQTFHLETVVHLRR
jgi:23S rRNA (uracil1939-C5)-methyltransferase